MNHQEIESLKQQLIELHYGLLDAREAQELRDRIASSEEVAELWLEAQGFAGKIQQATRLVPTEIEKTDFMELARHASVLEQAGHDSVQTDDAPRAGDVQLKVTPLAKGSGSRGRSAVWATGWAMIAAMIGCLVVGRGYLLRLPPSPVAKTALEIKPLSDHGLTGQLHYQVLTSIVNRSAIGNATPVVPANISFRLLSPAGVLFSGSTKSDRKGLARIVLPERLVIPQDAVLDVVAKASAGNVEASSLSLNVPRTRAVTHLTMDRPVYRPGDDVFFRSLTLNRRSLQPVSGFPIEFTLRQVVAAQTTENEDQQFTPQVGVTQSGVGQGVFNLPADVIPGDYELSVHSLDQMFPDETVGFQIRSYRVPLYDQKVRWTRESYRPGDRLDAMLQLAPVSQAIRSVPKMITASVLLGGEEQGTKQFEVSDEGKVEIKFDLPQQFSDGLNLRVTVGVGANAEVRTFPIPMQNGALHIDFYPEGGDLSAGVLNQVYFAVTDANRQAAPLRGWLVNRAGERLAEVETMYEGLGRFRFVPAANEQYSVEVVGSEASAKQSFKLPGIKEGLPVIDLRGGVIAEGESLQMIIRSEMPKTTLVQVACRGNVIARREIDLIRGDTEVDLPLDQTVGGVVRVTLLELQDGRWHPVAERLIFRRPSQRLQVRSVDQAGLVGVRSPGEKVQLELQVTNHVNQPQRAILGVSVVDQGSLSLRAMAPASMTTKFLLLSEIKHPADLEDADVLLASNAEAEQHLDLLLGTQGWRRFATWEETADADEFQALLVKLLSINGMDSADESVVGNQEKLVADWLSYRRAMDSSLKAAWVELGYVLIFMMGSWCFVFFCHRQRTQLKNTCTPLICLIAFGLSGLGLAGCGANVESIDAMIEADSQAEMANQPMNDVLSSNEEAATFGNEEPVEMAPAMLNQMPPQTSARRSTVPSPMLMDTGVALDQAQVASPAEWKNVDERWADLLPERKVAWLLRQLNQVRNAESENTSVGGETSNRLSVEDLKNLRMIRGMTAEAAAEKLIQELQFPIRQYAHQRVENTEPEMPDYQETLYWNPFAETDEEGRFTIEFDLSDAETNYQLQVDAHTFGGQLGSLSAEIVTQ